ncbi:MAG: NAD(P)-binding domain-containing protein [Cyanothece sp. SIO1E1]|nr:NAD(P)-binding domain-containing protein [Cyanothece sp. SIO1E1]
MKIGIIGSGNIGGTLGALWAKKGHEVMFSSRHPQKLQSMVEQIGHGSSYGNVENAAKWGEINLLAVSYWTLEEALTSIERFLDNKILVDATNPLKWNDSNDGVIRMIPEGISAGSVMAKRLPNARIVKAFTMPPAEILKEPTKGTGGRIAVPIAGDDDEAKHIVSTLVEHAGFEPVDVGNLVQSSILDPGSKIWPRALTRKELLESLNHDK